MLLRNRFARVRVAGMLLIALLGNLVAPASAAAPPGPGADQPPRQSPERPFPSPEALARLTPVDPSEVVALRGESHRVFRTDAGYQVELFARPVHYATEDGVYDVIDNTVITERKGGFAFRNKANRFITRFSDTPGAQRVQAEWRGTRLAFGVDESEGPLRARARGRQLEFFAPGAGYRYRYEVGPDLIKEEIVLDRFTGKTAWNFPLEVEGLIPQTDESGRIQLMLADAVNEAAWVFAPSFAVDAAGVRTDAVTQTLHSSGDGRYAVSLQVDPAWLQDPARAWPVTVDPTVSLDFFDGSRDPGMWAQLRSTTTTPLGTVDDLELHADGTRRALLKFDLTWIRNLLNDDAGRILQLSSAELRMYVSGLTANKPCNGGQCAAELIAEPVSRDWMMSLVTWNQPRWNIPGNAAEQNWTTPGGDVCTAGTCPELPASALYNSTVFYPSDNKASGDPVIVPLTELAQRWLDGFPNYGVRISLADNLGNNNRVYFQVRSPDPYNGYNYNSSPGLRLDFAYDATRPTVSIQSPAPDTQVAGNVTVQVTTADQVDSAAAGHLSRIDLLADYNRVASVPAHAAGTYSLQANLAGLIAGRHKLTARAYDLAGNYQESSVDVIVTDGLLAPPVNLRVVPTAAGAYALTWARARQAGAAGVTPAAIQYDVQRATNDHFTDAVTVHTTSMTSAADTPGAGTYYYRVVARTAALTSAPSNVATAAAPLAPAGLTATALSGGQVRLEWPESPSAADDPGLTYTVYRSGTPVQSDLAATAWTDTAAVGSAYSYEVSAVDRSGQAGARTAPVSVTAANPAGPPAPTGVRAAAERDNRIGLTWTPLSGAAVRYHVYRSTDQAAWTALTPSPIAGWFFMDSGLTEGTTYYYQVQAVDGGTPGPRSETAGALASPARRLGVDDRWTMVPFPVADGTAYLNLQTGNLALQVADAVLSGPVLANALRRTYNSQSAAPSLYGPGWRLNPEWRLEHRGTYLMLTEGDGTEHRFKPGGTAGAWESDDPRYFWSVSEPGDGTYVLHRPNEMAYRFSAAGRLTEIRDRTGNALTYAYDGTGRLSQVTNAAGRSLTFVYDSASRLTRVDYPTGRSVQYGYDAAGRLETVTDAEQHVTRYAYDASGRLGRATDPAGRWVALTYDGLDRLVSVTDSTRNRTRIAYGSGVTTVTDPSGYQTEFAFDARGWLTRLTDAIQMQQAQPQSWTYAYNLAASPWTITATNPRGLVTVAAFDERGNLVQVTDSGADLVAPGVNSRSTQYFYGGSAGTNNAGPNDLYRMVDAEGNATEYFYTATGPKRLERVLDAEGGTAVYTYDATNPAMIRTVTDANGNVTTYNYTPEWDVSAVVRAVYNPVTAATSQLVQSYEYVDGLPTSASDMYEQGAPTYPVVRTTYDKLGRATRVDYPDGSQESWIYDAGGGVGLAVDRGGVHVSFAYDAGNRLQAETAEDGAVTRYTYTGPVMTRVEGPDGLASEFAYDALYRTVAARGPDQTVTRAEYDAVGNATATLTGPAELFTNPQSEKAYRVSATYYLANLVREVTEPVPVSAILAAAGVTPHTDCAGTGTDCNVQTYTYNKLGNPLSLTDGNGYVTTYAYDRVQNLRFVTDPQGNPAEYVYDKLGNRTEVYKVGYPRMKADDDGSLYPTKPDKYEYDGLNRLVRFSTSVRGWYRDTVYSYSAAGDMVQEQRPTGAAVSYQYDSGHRLVGTSYTNSKRTPEVRYAVDAAGRRLMRRDAYGNTWYSYDSMGRPTQVRGQIDRVDYEYDVAGRRAAMTFSVGRVQYAYQQGRLQQVTDPLGNTATYQYDEYGHVSNLTVPLATLTNTFYRMPNLPSGDPGPMTGRLQKREWRSSDGTKQWWSGTYRYDHPGNVRDAAVKWHSSIATSTNKLPASQTITYTYDQVYRLTQYHDTDTYKSPYNTYSYQYDSAGNRTSAGNTTDAQGNLRWRTPAGTTVSLDRLYNFYDPHEGRIDSAFKPGFEQVGPDGDLPNVEHTDSGAISREDYYRSGNTSGMSDYMQDYSYDDADRVWQTRFEHPDEGCFSSLRWFAYDGDGRLAAADSFAIGCSGASRTVYEYDGATAISENGNHGDGSVWYITGPDGTTLFSLRVQGRDLKPDAHVTDHLGSTVEVITRDTSGTVKIGNWYAYDPFGVIQGSSTELLNSYTFTSSVRDHLTGLYFMGARVYNANTGRFLTQDTWKGSAWIPGTQNRYAYVGNNPTNYIDPSGHSAMHYMLDWGNDPQYDAETVNASVAAALGGGTTFQEPVPEATGDFTITAILCPSCVEGLGHAALIVQNGKDAYYYSFAVGGTDASPRGPGDLATAVIEGGGTLDTADLMTIVNQNHRIPRGLGEYRVGIEWTVSPDQAKLAMAAAEEYGKGEYGFLSRNCLGMVDTALTAVGIRTDYTAVTLNDPVQWFRDTIRAHVTPGDARYVGPRWQNNRR